MGHASTRTLARIASPLKEFGVAAGFLYGVDRVLARVGSPVRLYCYELMVQPIADKPIAPPNLVKSTEIREIAPDDPALARMPVPADVIRFRLRQPTVCLGAFRKGELIAYMWLCFGPYEEDEVRCVFVPEPADQAVFDFDFYVFPEHRLGLAFVALWDGANRYLRGRGILHSCSRVSRFNTASRKTHEHFGWRCVGRALYLKGRRVQLMLATVAPWVHLSLSEAATPRIPLRPPQEAAAPR